MHFFHQEDLNDCGLACLAMLIHHHQKQLISPYQLKKLLPETSQGGITFFDLINLGAHFGLKGLAYFCEFNLLKEQTQLPILINIKDKNDLNHFVLLTEITHEKIKLLDPAIKFGRQEFTWNEFNNFYLGQILIFQKTKKWRPQIPWKLIFNYAQKQWNWLFLITLTNIVSNYLWFLANFFIRYLEAWLITGEMNYLILVQFSFYLLGGGLCYLFQLYGRHHLQQLLWRNLLASYLNGLKIIESDLFQNHDFWEKINHQHQTLNFFFIVITKFFSNLALFPLIIWVIIQANYWIFLFCLIFITFNTLINNFCLRFRSYFQNQEDWEKADYYKQIALYISNFTNFKKRQYHWINYKVLQNKEIKYFKTEGRSHFWIILSEINQQLTQRIFGLVFWFLIFLLILKQSQTPQNLLVLSITTQLWLSISIDWIHNYLFFNYQKNYLYDLIPLNNAKVNLLIKPIKKSLKINIFHLDKFSFNSPGHFYQLPSITFKIPLQISGSKEILDSFYRACLTEKFNLLINNQPLIDYESDLFAIDYEAVPIATTIGANIFLGQQINKSDLDKINLNYWLKKYHLELYQTIDFNLLSKAQLQVINFLSLLFSNYKLYFLNQPLNELPVSDYQLLWKLLFELKKDKYLIIFGEIDQANDFGLDKLNLDDMI